MEKDLQLSVTMIIECAREIHKLLGSFLQAADRIPLWPGQPPIPEGSQEEAAAVDGILVKAGIKDPEPAQDAPAGIAPAQESAAETAHGTAPETPDDSPAPSYEDVRKTLSQKSVAGFKAEVKALLTRHGLERLSDVKKLDKSAAAKTLQALQQEAEAIGNA